MRAEVEAGEVSRLHGSHSKAVIQVKATCAQL